MKTNVIPFRGNVSAPATRYALAKTFQATDRVHIRGDARPIVPVRDLLVAVWHVSPASGRLECRWTAERGAAADEGASRIGYCRHAA
jgi:hypothetical protein